MPDSRARGTVDRRDLVGGKGSIFYRAHSYHTKVPVEALTSLIEHYTEPGDTVVDPFCGSGMTGVAALLTGRHAVISDLSPAAVHIARGYTAKLNPAAYRSAAFTVLGRLADVERDLYQTDDGLIEYTVWSDVLACPTCGSDIVVWDTAVDLDQGTVAKTLSCPNGHGRFTRPGLAWRRSIPVHRNLSVPGQRRRKTEVVDRTLDPNAGVTVEGWHPDAPWEPWREMWRAQHREMGIATAADFYTRRNLAALTAVWAEIDRLDDETMRSALRFTFTSIVNRASRRYQWHPKRPTNVLSSTMYVAPLNYEFNVFSMLRRKVEVITNLYRATQDAPGTCDVHQGSATTLRWLEDGSADYVFTDPPFGSNIYYADSSFLWEAWLGTQTDVAAEAVVNKRVDADRGGKGLVGYQRLITESLSEMSRVARPHAWLSLQFHNSDDAVWSSIQHAVEDAGLRVDAAVVMDKTQASFKGLRHAALGERVANFDLVMHLHRVDESAPSTRPTVPADEVAAVIARHLASASPAHSVTPFVHSVVMRALLERNASLDGWSFRAVEQLLSDRFVLVGNRWTLPTNKARKDS